MKQSKSKIVIEDYKNDFTYEKNVTNLNIQFNRVAFIFFAFFIIYLIYTIHLIHLGSRVSKLDKIENLDKINLEVPPEQFNFDLSCNIAMVLGKSNKLAPKKLAEKLRKLFLDQIKNFSNVEIAGPGFLNIKLSKSALIENINSILKNNENCYFSVLKYSGVSNEDSGFV